MYEKLALFINGEWTNGSGRGGEDVINPATEAALGRLPHATVKDLDRALESAAKGYTIWRKTPAYDRARIIKKAADIVRANAESIATTLTTEQGKVLAEARIEVNVSADILEWYAEEGRRAYGRIIPGRMPNQRQMVVKEPIGVSAAFTPWNFPALTPVRKIGGALAAGCSLILKASEETPGACVAIVRAFQEAGLPPGVLNLVFGVPAEVSEHIIASPIVRKFSFTGSIPVGKHLARIAADHMKRATMELGGHGPVIVFDDVDAEKVAAAAAVGKFRNAGQVCISPTRFFVHDKVYDRFVEKFASIAKDMKVGNGLDKDTQMGPMANARRVEAMEKLVGDAVQRGARVAAGGQRLGNQGYFYAPTILADVPDDARVMNDEPFGPVAPCVRFKEFGEVVHQANKLPFGLAAYAFTNSTERATAVADALESGMVGVNHFGVSLPETPFGGVKESGYGHEGGIEGLDAYLVTKFVSQLPTA